MASGLLLIFVERPCSNPASSGTPCWLRCNTRRRAFLLLFSSFFYLLVWSRHHHTAGWQRLIDISWPAPWRPVTPTVTDGSIIWWLIRIVSVSVATPCWDVAGNDIRNQRRVTKYSYLRTVLKCSFRLHATPEQGPRTVSALCCLPNRITDRDQSRTLSR